MGGGPGGDGRDDKDKKVRFSDFLRLVNSSKTTPAEGQAEVRASAAAYHSHRTKEAQGRWPEHRLQAARYISYLAV